MRNRYFLVTSFPGYDWRCAGSEAACLYSFGAAGFFRRFFGSFRGASSRLSRRSLRASPRSPRKTLRSLLVAVHGLPASLFAASPLLFYAVLPCAPPRFGPWRRLFLLGLLVGGVELVDLLQHERRDVERRVGVDQRRGVDDEPVALFGLAVDGLHGAVQ